MAKTVNDLQFEMAKRNYERGLWTEKNLELAVKVGRITEEQKNAIINGAE